MSDFYSVLKQSIIDRGLSSPEAREEAYAQARRAMINRLWSYDPPLAEDEIDNRIGQFDTAVARIEDDVASAFATLEAVGRTGGDGRSDDDDDGYVPAFGGTVAVREEGYDEDPEADEALPELGPVPGTLRTIEERSRAVERALSEAAAIEDERTGPAPRDAAAYDADLAGWPGSGATAEEDALDDAAAAPAPAVRRQRPPPGPRSATRLARSPLAAVERALSGLPGLYSLPVLIGLVAVLAALFVGGLIWLLLPASTPPRHDASVLQTDVPGGVSDPETAIRLPKEAIAVTNSFSLFDGKDPTVFVGDPDNPVRFDGELARIATSISSAGAKIVIGAGLSSRLAGRTIRVTVDARSARENGATSMRFAYQSGVAISHWQTANLSSTFTELGLVWRVPALRTNPSGDYIIIEPGIPGSGTGVEIRSVRIDLVDD